eukprot:5486824-Pyramimonas_sp.AAC.1
MVIARGSSQSPRLFGRKKMGNPATSRRPSTGSSRTTPPTITRRGPGLRGSRKCSRFFGTPTEPSTSTPTPTPKKGTSQIFLIRPLFHSSSPWAFSNLIYHVDLNMVIIM